MNSLKNHRGKILFFLGIALIAGGYFYFWSYQPDFSKAEITSVELVISCGGVEKKLRSHQKRLKYFIKIYAGLEVLDQYLKHLPAIGLLLVLQAGRF